MIALVVAAAALTAAAIGALVPAPAVAGLIVAVEAVDPAAEVAASAGAAEAPESLCIRDRPRVRDAV